MKIIVTTKITKKNTTRSIKKYTVLLIFICNVTCTMLYTVLVSFLSS